MQKTILITGCSTGIGNATCHYLKKRGYRVFATARRDADVIKLQHEGFESFKLDVNDSAQITDVINSIKELTGGTLYALCNNAGYAQPGALEDISRDSLRSQFETNVFGLQELTNQVLPLFRKQGYGRIVHVSSILGIVSLPFRGAYNASKYAVEGLADTLRLELRDTQIYVSLIIPGPIQSQFRDNAIHAYRQNINTEASVYAKQYHRFLTRFITDKNNLSFIAKPQAVAKKIVKALESPHPKARYYVTVPSHLFGILKRILPQRLLDLILANVSNREIN